MHTRIYNIVLIFLFFFSSRSIHGSNDSLKIVFSVNENITDVLQLKSLLNANPAVSMKAYCDRQHAFLVFVAADVYNTKSAFMEYLRKQAPAYFQVTLSEVNIKNFAEKCEAFDSFEAERIKFVGLNE